MRIISEMRAHSPQSLPRGAAVIGAGTMGTGIALVLARAGVEVQLTARSAATLDRARARLAAEPAGASIHTTTSLETALAGVGLVIETIVEEVEPKRAVLAAAERLAEPGAILTSNTSSLPLASLTSALEERGRFAGWHWFNPPELVRLVEIVRGEETSPPVVETLRDRSRCAACGRPSGTPAANCRVQPPAGPRARSRTAASHPAHGRSEAGISQSLHRHRAPPSLSIPGHSTRRRWGQILRIFCAFKPQKMGARPVRSPSVP